MEKNEDDAEEDIESSIQKELESMGNRQGKQQMFSSVQLDIPCLLFFKTQRLIDPVDFVHRICEEIVSQPGIRKMRYINRLTPMTSIGKATEKGLEDIGKAVLGKHFQLAGEKSKVEGERSVSCSVSTFFSIKTLSPLELHKPLHKPQSTTHPPPGDL